MIEEAAPGPASCIYFSERLRLHYVDWGNPEAPPILLLHGGRDHCRNWDWVAAELRPDYHVIAPDLRGHGDSGWAVGGGYRMEDFIYDLAQLIHQQKLAPVTIVAHSYGAMIALRYAGIYPENVAKLVAIEGVGAEGPMSARLAGKTAAERLGTWIEEMRHLAGRLPRRYPKFEDAVKRMQGENAFLSAEQLRHLTRHGVNQNEDGTYSWKFDNYVRALSPYGLPDEELAQLWERISAPTLLVYGKESWAVSPETDGRIRHFHTARCVTFEGSGHWVHHDKFTEFLALLRGFLAE